VTYIEIHTTCIASPLSHCDFVHNSRLDWWCLIHIEHHKPNENIFWKFVGSLYITSHIPYKKHTCFFKDKEDKSTCCTTNKYVASLWKSPLKCKHTLSHPSSNLPSSHTKHIPVIKRTLNLFPNHPLTLHL
jgi:hypothetical protein